MGSIREKTKVEKSRGTVFLSYVLCYSFLKMEQTWNALLFLKAP